MGIFVGDGVGKVVGMTLSVETVGNRVGDEVGKIDGATVGVEDGSMDGSI